MQLNMSVLHDAVSVCHSPNPTPPGGYFRVHEAAENALHACLNKRARNSTSANPARLGQTPQLDPKKVFGSKYGCNSPLPCSPPFPF